MMNTEELELTRNSRSRRQESPDLSAEIMRTIDRQPGDRVRCRRVYGDKYRCNWLAPEAQLGGGLAVETYQIRQSRFLRVTQTEKGLEVEDLTIAR